MLGCHRRYSTAFVGVNKSIDNLYDEKTKVWLQRSWLCGWDAQGLEACSVNHSRLALRCVSDLVYPVDMARLSPHSPGVCVFLHHKRLPLSLECWITSMCHPAGPCMSFLLEVSSSSMGILSLHGDPVSPAAFCQPWFTARPFISV